MMKELSLDSITHVFLDCDDCLYRNEWATAKRITASIAKYTSEKLGVSSEQAYGFYKKYGTCLKGLLVEGIIDEAGVEAFLREVHDIDYGDIAPDPKLRSLLQAVTRAKPTWIFTASVREHAQRCLEAIGIADLPFCGIIDTRDCQLETKYAASSFEAAMRIAGAADPTTCLFADDSIKNVVAAKKMGWLTVLVGLQDRDTGARIECPEADAHLASLRDIAQLLGLGTSANLAQNWVHLGLGATALVEPPFTGMAWYGDYSDRRAADGAEGRLVSMHTFSTSWDVWEVHPEGSEVVLCTAGSITLIQELAQGKQQCIVLHPGEFAINGPGVWHTADVQDTTTCVFITAGRGTQHRARSN